MTMQSLADELADVRADLLRLRLREAQLRAALIAAPAAQRCGRWNEVEVTARKRLVFNPYLLPAEVRQNPLYWEDVAHHTVSVKPLAQGLKPRPGWPIRREAPVPALH
jgi:hypothetical protein